MEREILEIVSKNYKETFELGKRLADFLKKRDVVALYGELGSGKTVFAQGICAGLDVKDYVTSPSFVLVKEYQGRMKVFHFDFYRLESQHEVENLDIDNYLQSDAVSIIEWPEIGEAYLPEERISVTFNRLEENGKIVVEKRLIRFTAPKRKGLSNLRL